MQMVSWPVLSLKIGQLYSNTDRENDPTNLDINFYSFSNSLETKSAKASYIPKSLFCTSNYKVLLFYYEL